MWPTGPHMLSFSLERNFELDHWCFMGISRLLHRSTDDDEYLLSPLTSGSCPLLCALPAWPHLTHSTFLWSSPITEAQRYEIMLSGHQSGNWRSWYSPPGGVTPEFVFLATTTPQCLPPIKERRVACRWVKTQLISNLSPRWLRQIRIWWFWWTISPGICTCVLSTISVHSVLWSGTHKPQFKMPYMPQCGWTSIRGWNTTTWLLYPQYAPTVSAGLSSSSLSSLPWRGTLPFLPHLVQ